MKEEIIETDILCVGGGIVGLMAAIRASDMGAKVTIAEKGNILTSGKAGGGNDHFLCYLPQVHGSDLNAYIDAMMETQQASNFQGLGIGRVRTHIARTAEIVGLWDNWGIPMKYKGDWEFGGHAYPGGLLCLLKYQGRNQKSVLTGEAVKRGVKIVNRVMVTDLLVDGSVAGAVGVGTRDERLIVFKAKSVILGTGGVTRLYPGITPAVMNNYQFPMTLTADGRVMAYHAGAEIQDLERYRLHVGPRYFARSGQATWVGVYRDPEDKPIGPFVTRPERKYGDITPEVNKGIFADCYKSGRGPVYMDGRGMSDEDYAYMKHWMVHEGLSALLQNMEEEGIDLQNNPVEFVTYHMGGEGRIRVDKDARTSLDGIYAAGDEVANGISNAATFGWIAGENAVKYVKEKAGEADIKTCWNVIEERKKIIGHLGNRKSGVPWKEANVCLQQVMADFAGTPRHEHLLQAGMNHLARLKQKALQSMAVSNQHELERSLEVLNLMDLGELIFTAARERKETRATHVRLDYPLTNPRMNKKILVLKKVNGRPFADWQATKP